MFADDNQLLSVFPVGNKEQGSAAVSNVEDCIHAVGRWLVLNNLCFNGSKTEFLPITSSRRTPSIEFITVDGTVVPKSISVRNLGAWFDCHMDMSVQVKKVCQGAFANLHRIGRIRKYLDIPTTKRLVNSLVMSKLDYNNALLQDLPKTSIAPLQRVQNAAARLITRTRRRDHITPILKDLHWLPVSERVGYKVLTLTYRSLHGLAPVYLQTLLHPHSAGRTTRLSQNQDQLALRRTRTLYGDRSFSVSAARLWNTLPQNITNSASVLKFKKELKTFLFRKYYGS